MADEGGASGAHVEIQQLPSPPPRQTPGKAGWLTALRWSAAAAGCAAFAGWLLRRSRARARRR